MLGSETAVIVGLLPTWWRLPVTTCIREFPEPEYMMVTGESIPQTPARATSLTFKTYDDSPPDNFGLCREVSLNIPLDFIQAYVVNLVAVVLHISLLSASIRLL